MLLEFLETPMKLTSLNQLEKDGEVFEGEWQLDEHHDLVYRERKGKKEARLKGTLVAAEAGIRIPW